MSCLLFDLRLHFLAQEITQMAKEIDENIVCGKSKDYVEAIAEAKATIAAQEAKSAQIIGEIDHMERMLVFELSHHLYLNNK